MRACGLEFESPSQKGPGTRRSPRPDASGPLRARADTPPSKALGRSRRAGLLVRRDGASSQPSPQPTPWQQEAPSLPSPQPTSWLQEAPAPPPAPPRATPPPAPVGLWQWESRPDAWAPMDTAACRQLDQARASGERTVVLSHLPGGPCRVDLAQMVQTNVRTGTQRRIRRGAGGTSAPPPRPPPRQPGSTLMRVKIPPNMPPGGSITVRAPDGRLVRVRVPQGVAPGATITVRI